MNMLEKLAQLQQFFQVGSTKDYAFRIKQLNKLAVALKLYESQLLQALHLDLNKPEIEAFAAELGLVYRELRHMRKYLKRYMCPQKVASGLALFPSRSYIYQVPLGVVLIIAPWNYPIQLLLIPLIGAIAAGNCIVVKPSEYAPHTEQVLRELIESTFGPEYVLCLEGDGSKLIPPLLHDFTFNHVFFTGSTNVGRQIAKQCAEKLVPYTLELGGKSPAIIDRDVELNVACKRISWAKFYNAGQSCIAPDYVLVHDEIKDQVIAIFKQLLAEFYPINMPIAKIINQERYLRLTSYLEQEKEKIIYGGDANLEQLSLTPTLVLEPSLNSPLMTDEIFGPILPIISYTDISEIYKIINHNPNPLALYVFSANNKFSEEIISKVQFGGGGVNMTLLHLINHNLPFGGVMASGSGAYHGKFSFTTFSHTKSIVKQATWFDAPFKYPPYSKFKSWIMRRVFG
jgi:aldehyde dehydrogenase (NAD+)